MRKHYFSMSNSAAMGPNKNSCGIVVQTVVFLKNNGYNQCIKHTMIENC